jgi:hypothetical protein
LMNTNCISQTSMSCSNGGVWNGQNCIIASQGTCT